MGVTQEGGLESVGSELPLWRKVDGEMSSDTLITDAVFEAFLHCDTKAYLLHQSIDNQSKLDVWDETANRQFKQRVAEWLRSRFGDDEVYVGVPSRPMLEQGSHGIVLRPS